LHKVIAGYKCDCVLDYYRGCSVDLIRLKL
jgi:hypothetical protein